MSKSLGGAVIDLLDSERVELRTAAATVLAVVGKGDKAVETALTSRLADSDGVVRRIALDALAEMGTGGIAAKLVPLLHGDDDELAARAAAMLAQQGAAAEATLRKEVGGGPVPARRVMAQLLIRRGTTPAVDAVLDQLGDHEFGEQALQLLRAALDEDGGSSHTGKLAALVEKAAMARAGERSKELDKLVKAAPTSAKPTRAKPARTGKTGKTGKNGNAPSANGRGSHGEPPGEDIVRLTAELGILLRLIGYLARPSTQGMLLGFTEPDKPRPVRLAAIAGLRRIVATSEAKGTEKVIESLIELAGVDDLAVAQAAVDTLRGARIPEALAKPFAALAKSKNAAAQTLAMERLPAGGGAGAVKALVEAIAGDDPTARDAAARGLAKAPEAVLPLVRALLATSDENIARRYAGVLRSHRGNVSNQAIDELVDQVRSHMDAHLKGKVTADDIVIERVLAELVADLAPARHVELLFERARRLRKQGKSVEAFGSLKPLLRTRADLDAAIDSDQRYLLALLALEAAGEGLIRTMKGDDPVLDQFARLAASGFPVGKQLARENDVSDEVLYGLGFRLLETGDGRNEELGAELLQGIIDERPRSKLAKAAKNKLKLTGHLDDG